MMNWDYIKKDKKSFYKNRSMMGYIWASEMLDKVNAIVKDPKLNKTKLQKYIISNSFRFDKDLDWHYFANQLTDKYVAQVKHMLKRLTKQNVLSELNWLGLRTGMLRTPLEKALHVLAYKLDKKNYIDSTEKTYQWYGMGKKASRERAQLLVKAMEKDLKMKWRN